MSKKKIVGLIFVAFLLLFGGYYFLKREVVVHSKVFRIGRDSTWYPLNLKGKEKNMVGFTNELVRLLSKIAKVPIQIVEIGPVTLLEELDRGDIDGAFSLLAPNVITKKTYVFSDPIYLAGPVVVVQTDSAIQSLRDLDGKIVGVETGENLVFMVQDTPVFLIIPYNNVAIALENLVNNTIDAVITDLLDATQFSKGVMAGQIRIATAPLNNYGVRVVAKQTPRNIQIMSRMNEALQEIESQGIYDQLIEKWGLVLPIHETP